jgi:hypothetical protein
MKARTTIPPDVAEEVLVANDHTCCICREARKHVQLHHIYGDPSNNDAGNLSVLCLDCHSRVTGDEGLGRKYSAGEVTRYKVDWEAICAESEDDSGEVDQPVQVLRRSFRVRAGDHAQYDFNLEEGWEFEITVSADDYVGVSSCGQRDYKRWIDGGELMQYEGEDDARHCELDFTAPKNGTYLLLVINEGAEDVDVTLDASLWEEAAEE